MDSKEKFNLGAPTTPTAAMGPQHQQPECDYDTNPTVLYQAIEAKQWDYAVSLFVKNKIEGGESGTWVVRKETNGKLRWRLLPLHAAIIFGSPVKLVECLLADYPAAASCKDDQGMLPLHLAFRNEGSASWEIIDELLTAYPQAIFVKDRKGRTPLQCGIQLTSVSSALSVSSAPPQQSKTFKSVVSVLDLYSQIVVSGERQRAQQDARKQVEARMTQIQETHLQTLTALKREFSTQQEESMNQMALMREEQEALIEQINEQDMTIENLERTEIDLQRKLEDMSMKMHQTGNRNRTRPLEELVSSSDTATNDTLRFLVHDLVAQQQEYHLQFSALVGKYEQLAEERKRILEVFTKETDNQDSREAKIVENFKEWLDAKEQKLQRMNLGGGKDDEYGSVEGDEKKVENSDDHHVERSIEVAKVVDLSNAAPDS